MAPRLIRRRPLAERIRAYLDPVDFLLWLSEEMDSSEWDKWSKEWATPIGVSLNFVFLIARANVGSQSGEGDEVFGDASSTTGWLTWPMTFLVHLLSLLSILNTIYTFYRRRHYRLFENPIETVPGTPSAQRVRVDSSPVSSSPLRFLSNIVATNNAESRSHPDATRDVWEIAVWDPTPLSLQTFCLFSPGHVLLYWFFLPVRSEDPRPSVTVVTTVILALLLSIQMLFLQRCFSQQSKDSSIIHREVMNEYDTKFVHPRSQPLMRDVGTQVAAEPATEIKDENVSVDTFPPAFIINRGFRTRPNPNYVKHVDPDASAMRPTPSRGSSTGLAPVLHTPAQSHGQLSPVLQQTAIRQPQFRSSGSGDGGSLGVYSHANSPLKKSTSSNTSLRPTQRESLPTTSKREASPLKQNGPGPFVNEQRFGYIKNALARRASGRF